MVMRPSTGRVRQEPNEAPPTTRGSVQFSPGVSVPSPPDVTTPTLAPQVSVQAGGATTYVANQQTGEEEQTGTQQTDTAQMISERQQEERRIYDGFVEAAERQIQGIGDATIFEGRYFYESAPLGLEWAGRTMRVPLGLNSETQQYEYADFFELDRSALIRSRRQNLPQPTSLQQAQELVAAGTAPLLDAAAAERELNMLSAQDLQNVKIGLVQIGALDYEDMGSLNTFDTQSNPKIGQAFQRLVALAQNNMMDWRSMMARMVRNNETVAPVSTSATGSGAMPAFRLTAEADLRAVADNVATRTIGRALTDEEAQTFVTSYQNMERAYQRQLMGGGEVQMAPSADVAAQQQIRQDLSEEYDVYQMGNTLDMFRQIIGGVG